MPPGYSNIVALATLIVPLGIMLALWKRPRLGIAITIPILVIGWVVVFHASVADVDADVAAVHAKWERGERLSAEEEMYDGVGDRAAVFMMGWVPGAAGFVVGGTVAFVVRRWKARLGRT